MIKHFSDREMGNIEDRRKNVETGQDKEEKREENPTTDTCKGPITKESLMKENMTSQIEELHIFLNC